MRRRSQCLPASEGTETPINCRSATPWRDVIYWQIASGVEGIVPVGTTGESPTLEIAEHIDVIRVTVEVTSYYNKPTAEGLYPLFRDLFLETSPIPVKAALARWNPVLAFNRAANRYARSRPPTGRAQPEIPATPWPSGGGRVRSYVCCPARRRCRDWSPH